MRVLTVRQPWASAIIYLGKNVENRPRVWTYTGPVAVHAGKEWDLAAFDDPALLAAIDATPGLTATRVRAGLEGEHFPTSAVLGVVDLIGAHRSDVGCCPGNRWARWPEHDNPAGYIGHHALRNPRPLTYPIPASGKLGLWRPGELLADEIDTLFVVGYMAAGFLTALLAYPYCVRSGLIAPESAALMAGIGWPFIVLVAASMRAGGLFARALRACRPRVAAEADRLGL